MGTPNYRLDSRDNKLLRKKFIKKGVFDKRTINSSDIARCRSGARKQLVVVRFGYLERLVLEYSKYHGSVQSAGVRSWARELGLDLNLKRVHDSIQRLVRKGILVKKSHGVYTLTDFGRSLIPALQTFNSKANKVRKETDFMCCSGSLCRDCSCGGGRVVRVHAYASSFEDYVRRVWVAYRLLDCVVRYLRGLLGYSRFRSLVSGVSVDCRGFVFGVHGVRGYRFRELKDVRFVESLGLVPNEFGFDVHAVVGGVEKMFLKVYTR